MDMYNNAMNMNNGMMGGMMPGMMPGMVPSANGLAFNQQKPNPKCNLTPEQLAKIKTKTGNTISIDEEDIIIGRYNYRDQNGLPTVELVDPDTNLVRDRVTGVEFHLVEGTPEYVYQVCKQVTDILNCCKLYGDGSEPEKLMDEFTSAGTLLTLNLPGVYERALKNVKKTFNQTNTVSPTGYMGATPNNMYNGYMNYNPGYNISLNGGMGMQPNMYAPMQPQPNYYQQMQPQAAPMMNNMAQPMGGTMMNNPFMAVGADAPMNQQPMMATPSSYSPQQQNVMNMGFSQMGGGYQPQLPQQVNPTAMTATPQINVPVPGNPQNPGIGAAAPQTDAASTTTATTTI